MKPWMKIALGISVLWTISMPFMMIHLILTPRPPSSAAIDPWALKLLLFSLANFLLIGPAWVVFIGCAVCRRDWSVGKRIAWFIGLVGGPWALITWPWFYLQHIVTHPVGSPVFGPRNS